MILLDLNSKERSQWNRIELTLDSNSDTAVVEPEVVGLEILKVDLEVDSELVDPEDTDEGCKLPLSTEMQSFL